MRVYLLCGSVVLVALRLHAEVPPTDYEILVYGGTSAAVAAAVQAARSGKSVVLIEPERRLGGLSSNGLGETDIGNKQAIGGIAREFYERVAQHYEKPSAWIWQERTAYHAGGESRMGDGKQSWWKFEPHVAERIFNDLIRESGVTVVRNERLDLKNGVEKTGAHITAIRLESGRRFSARIFIDATYEGDLMAKAGVTYTVGREANRTYGETLDGVQLKNSRNHSLTDKVDPYVRRGDPSSGLLAEIELPGPEKDGEGDRRIQAYCFRMCLTDTPDNRIPFAKPAGYDERDYELLFRNFEAGATQVPWINSPLPNHKTDTNNGGGVSTDFIGANYDYPDGDYALRETIVAAHRRYEEGLLWTLANHPRVPKKIRAEVSRWGLAKDEFFRNGGWPEEIYVREARRMTGAYVMTQRNCEGGETAPDSIGLAAYTMDSHNVRRLVEADGFVHNEGNIEAGGFPPYPISYRALTPKSEQCDNLLVPVCVSASHIAFGSIRMEPVFMVLGQSAATAAALAIDERHTVQEIDYTILRAQLLAAGQILENPVRPQVPPKPHF